MFPAELTSGRATQSLGHFTHVHDHSLDAVALALDFGQQARHLVAVEDIGDAGVDVQRHGGVGAPGVVGGRCLDRVGLWWIVTRRLAPVCGRVELLSARESNYSCGGGGGRRSAGKLNVKLGY